MSQKRKRSRRPPGVAVAALLHLLEWFLLLVSGGYYLLTSGALITRAGQLTLNPLQVAQASGTGSLLAVLSLPVLVAAFGLFFLRRWAWLMAMAIQGWLLASLLVSYLSGHAIYLLMAAGILLVLSLNQNDVRLAFRLKEDRDV